MRAVFAFVSLATRAVALELPIPSLAGTSWRVGLNVGRESGTAMPQEWAASGARLAIPVDVTFAPDEAADAQEPLLGERNGTCKLYVLDSGSRFVGINGEEKVVVLDGAWRATRSGRGGELFLRFYLDIAEAAQRNDVTLPAGRLFFSTGCWEASQLKMALEATENLRQEIVSLDMEELTAKAEAPSLFNLVEQVRAARDGAVRNERRNQLRSTLSVVVQSLPGPSGTVDGPEGLKMGKRGGMCVKRRGKLGGEEYPMLGTFTMASLEASPPRTKH